MKKEILKMLSSDEKLDLNKVSLFMTTIASIVLASYAVVTNSSIAEPLFITMVGAGVGTTVTKGVVDTVQKRKERE